MGSGETGPTMVKTHRELFERLGPDRVPAVLLDTPFGFQENADDISARAVDYFAPASGQTVEVVELPPRSSDADAGRAPSGAGPAPPGPLGVRRAGQPDLRHAPVGRHGRARTCWPTSCGTAGLRHLRQRRRPDPGRRHGAGLRDLQGRRRSGMGRRARPARARSASGGGHPALRQRRGRQPRHPASVTWASGGCGCWSAAARRRRSCSAWTSTPAACSTWTPARRPSSASGQVTVRRQGRSSVVPSGRPAADPSRELAGALVRAAGGGGAREPGRRWCPPRAAPGAATGGRGAGGARGERPGRSPAA